VNAVAPLLLLLLALAGCREDRTLVIEDDLSEPQRAPTAYPLARESREEGAPSAADVPLAEDYADEAERIIGERNAEDELVRIETELDDPAAP
jgi:hypothetical protein